MRFGERGRDAASASSTPVQSVSTSSAPAQPISASSAPAQPVHVRLSRCSQLQCNGRDGDRHWGVTGMHRYHFDGVYLQLYLEFFSARVIWSLEKGFAKEILSEGGFRQGFG